MKGKPALRKVLGPLPDWLISVIDQPRVAAKQMTTDFRISLAKGPIKQPGRRSVQFERYDVGKAGDYLVLIATEQVPVPRKIFESAFEKETEEPTAR